MSIGLQGNFAWGSQVATSHDPGPVIREIAPVGGNVVLRPYQVKAVEAVCTELRENRSTLLVMATGTGKTQCFADVIRRWPGKALVLAHRDELIQQGAQRIRAQTGKIVGIEKAEASAGYNDDVVVASVQSLCQETRLRQFEADEFGLLVVDEAHHAVAQSYKRILDYFTGAKILGVTATPDRADRLAMGQVFESVAYVYEIEDAINDGYLCPITCTSVLVDSLSLAEVKTTAGDLNQGDLDAIMSAEKVLHGVVKPTLELAGNRRTLVFTTSVENAHRMAEVFNRYREGCADAVDGGMAIDDRRRVLARHQRGEFQFLVNVGIATEGYDDPAISCVSMGRPTKSRALYTQMVGRGTRIMPGKANLLVLDMVGNAGRHALVSALDILAGRYEDDVVARARKKVERDPGRDARAVLEEAKAEIEAEKEAAARRNRVRAQARYRTETVNPFKVLGIENPAERWGGQFGSKQPSQKMLDVLAKWKVPLPENVTFAQASRLIGSCIDRAKKGLCSFGQAKVLQKRGYDTSTMTRAQAGRIMDALAQNNWRPLSHDQNRALLNREPGEDG